MRRLTGVRLASCSDLFGASNQLTGINFKKYEDIPVEATGTDVPKPIDKFDDSEVRVRINGREESRSPAPPPGDRGGRRG